MLMVNMTAKFGEDVHNGVVSIVFTSSKCDTCTQMNRITIYTISHLQHVAQR